MAEQPLPSDFNEIIIEDLVGGLDVSRRPTAIADNQVADINNLVFDKLRLRIDTGFAKFFSTVRGNPRVAWQFYKTNGSSELVLITNSTIYKRASNEWQYVADGDGSAHPESAVSTTTTSGEAAGATSVTVASITGFSDADYIGITLDDGTQHQTTVNGAPAASTINFDDPIPAGRSVNNGAVVLKAVDLSGSDDEAVSVVVAPAYDWLCFTNGVDGPMYYDGSLVGDIPNLPSSGNTQCKALALYFNHLVLIHTVEGGAAKPQRFRWSDTADFTEWAAGNAGFIDLVDTEDFLLAGLILGPYLVIYRERSLVRVEYVGADDKLFDYDTVVTSEGALGHDVIVDMGDSHVFAGNANIYRYNGGFDIDPIGDEIYYKVFGVDGELIPSYKHRSMALYVEELDEMWLFYPADSDTYPTHLARFRNDIGSWTLRTLSKQVSGFGFYQLDTSKTWQEMEGNWTEQNTKWNSNTLLANAPTTLLCGPESDQVYEYDYQIVDEDGTEIDWFFVSKMFHQPHFIIRTDFVEFKAKGGSITIYYRKDEDDGWRVWGTKTLTADRRKYRVHKQITAERVQFRFEGTGGGFSIDWLAFAYAVESEH